ncbi:MAG TPA: helix-turn-helix domain-containing protein [Gemmataceae bacterium]|nr:helix-turn-helix domain-containing protein [Gemmataceae bacterium]
MKRLLNAIGAAAIVDSTAGLTVREIARRYRVSPDKVRGWIVAGQLRAVNRRDARCGRPSWVIMPEALHDFERGRTVTATTKPVKRRKRTKMVDYYPD